MEAVDLIAWSANIINIIIIISISFICFEWLTILPEFYEDGGWKDSKSKGYCFNNIYLIDLMFLKETIPISFGEDYKQMIYAFRAFNDTLVFLVQ